MKLEGIVRTAVRETRSGVKDGRPWEMEVAELVVVENQSPDSLITPVVVKIDKSQWASLPKNMGLFVGKQVSLAVTDILGLFAGKAQVSARILSQLPA